MEQKSAFASYMARFYFGFLLNIHQNPSEVNSVNLHGAKPPVEWYIRTHLRPFTDPFKIL